MGFGNPVLVNIFADACEFVSGHNRRGTATLGHGTRKIYTISGLQNPQRSMRFVIRGVDRLCMRFQDALTPSADALGASRSNAATHRQLLNNSLVNITPGPPAVDRYRPVIVASAD